MPFSTLDVLAVIDAPLLAAPGCFDRLAVDCSRAGRGLPMSLDAGERAESIQEVSPGPVLVPPSEVVVDGLPRGEVVRQRSPSTTVAGLVEQSVDNCATRSCRPTATTVTAGLRQQRLDQGPLSVREVAGIRLARYASFYAKPDLWNTYRLRSISPSRFRDSKRTGNILTSAARLFFSSTSESMLYNSSDPSAIWM